MISKGHYHKDQQLSKEALEYVLAISRKLEKLYVYSHLKNDQDTANTTYQGLYAKSQQPCCSSKVRRLPGFDPELLSMDDATIWGYFDQEPELAIYRHLIEKTVNNRPHVLPAEQEALLAGAGEIFGASGNIFFSIKQCRFRISDR